MREKWKLPWGRLLLIYLVLCTAEDYNTTVTNNGKRSQWEFHVYDTLGHLETSHPTGITVENQLGECNEEDLKYKETKEYPNIQLLKVQRQPVVDVTQCKLEFSVSVAHCGLRVIITRNDPEQIPVYKAIVRMNGKHCDKLQRMDEIGWNVAGKSVQLKRRNKAVSEETVIVHGRHEKDQDCYGDSFTFQSKEYTNHIMRLKYKIVVKTWKAKYISTKKIVIPKLTSFNVNSGGETWSDEYGLFVYDAGYIPETDCDKTRDLLKGIHLTGAVFQTNSSQRILIVKREERRIMTTMIANKTTLCGREVLETSHDDIYVHVLRDQDKAIETRAIDPTEQVMIDHEANIGRLDSKILDLGLAVSNDLDSLIMRICENRRRQMIAAMAEQSSYDKTHVLGQGYSTSNRGSATIITKGVRLTARARMHDQCCKELPISLVVSDKKAFVELPRMIVRTFCTERPCSSSGEYYYKIKDTDGNTRWLCTKGGPLLKSCTTPATVIPIMDRDIRTQVHKMIQDKENFNSGLYSPEERQAHYEAGLVQEAQEALPAYYAMRHMDQIEGGEYNQIPEWAEAEGLHNIKNHVLGEVTRLMPGWGTTITVIVGVLLATGIIVVLWKMYSCLVIYTYMRRPGFTGLSAMNVNLPPEGAIQHLKEIQGAESARVNQLETNIMDLTNSLKKEQRRINDILYEMRKDRTRIVEGQPSAPSYVPEGMSLIGKTHIY